MPRRRGEGREEEPASDRDDRPARGWEASFQRLMDRFDYPMLIVTASDGRRRAGCLVGFTSQCSIDPLRYWVWLSRANHTYRVAQATDVLVVHAPTLDERDLAELFATRTGDEIDKFAEVAWSPGPDGRTPVLDRCPRWFAGRILERVDSGDHVGHLLEPFAAVSETGGTQLRFSHVKDFDAGHAP